MPARFFYPSLLDKGSRHFYNGLGIQFQIRGVAKFGIALGSGPRGRGFESRHSDQKHIG